MLSKRLRVFAVVQLFFPTHEIEWKNVYIPPNILHYALHCSVLALLFRKTSICDDKLLNAILILAVVTFVLTIFFKFPLVIKFRRVCVAPTRESDSTEERETPSLMKRIFRNDWVTVVICVLVLAGLSIYEIATMIKIAIPGSTRFDVLRNQKILESH